MQKTILPLSRLAKRLERRSCYVILSICHGIRLHFNRPEHPKQGVADGGELRAVGFAYRLLGLRLDSERIDGRAVVVDAEIEVGT